jgi:hypothetical protein
VVKDTETRATQGLSERQPLAVPGRHGHLILRPVGRPTITVVVAFQGQGCRAGARHIGPTTLDDGDSVSCAIDPKGHCAMHSRIERLLSLTSGRAVRAVQVKISILRI